MVLAMAPARSKWEKWAWVDPDYGAAPTAVDWFLL